MRKFSMLRVRLALVIGTSFGFVLFLGGVLYWGAQRVDAYFQRSQLAFEAFDRYEQLSEEAYRHFKQRLDSLLVADAASAEDVAQSKRLLFSAIEEIRASIFDEPETPATTPKPRDSNAEPERVARLTAFLESSMYRFDEIEHLRRKGDREQALLLLSRFLQDEIDGKFQPLIDESINGERQQALNARDRMQGLLRQLGWAAGAAALIAALFSLSSGVVLFRGIRRPIDALMRGTDEIAAGHLDYRIPVESGNEFGYLAGQFNRMAGELEAHRDQLEEAHRILEHKVEERTLELNKINRELQRLDQSRREFFADISHELRTPITVIRGEAEVTLRGGDRDTGEYKDALGRVLDLSQQLGKLVNDMLTLARAETANLSYEWDDLDMVELVRGTGEDLQVLAREKSIAVAWETPDSPVKVRGDRQRLRQVLFILGDNACRYSPPDTCITLTLRADGDFAELRFQDQGMGIPADDLETVFERYFRSKNTRGGVDGSGLGLPMAKSILTAHAGTISVASAEGQGTTFTLSLPQQVDDPFEDEVEPGEDDDAAKVVEHKVMND